MTMVSAQRVKAFSEAVDRLHHGDIRDIAAPERFFAAVDVLFDGVTTVLNIFDRSRDRYHHQINRALPNEQELLGHWAEIAPQEHPFLTLVPPVPEEPVLFVADLVEQRNWRESPIVREVHRPLTIGDQMGLLVTGGTASPEGLTFHRDKAFSEEDRVLMEGLTRHVRYVWEKQQVRNMVLSAEETLAATDLAPWRRKGLTRRQCEVLWWVREGKTNGEIAIILGVSRRTVDHHVAAILRALDVPTRVAAARAAGELLE
jgi:DNA-binding CsgD family transcriptional regulator